MSPVSFLFILLLLASIAYMQGKRRAFSLTGAEAGSGRLHSRPGYYGMLTALWCAIPALLIFAFWTAFSDSLLTGIVLNTLPDDMQNIPAERINLLVNDLRNLVAGHVAARNIDPVLQDAADQYIVLERISQMALGCVMLAIALFSAALVSMIS